MKPKKNLAQKVSRPLEQLSEVHTGSA